MKLLKIISLFLIVSACESTNEVPPITNDPPTEAEPTTLWFGYYQENALNNPEDPLSGIVYLDIPVNGAFAGELFFSYSGCDGGFDVGAISGNVSGNRIEATWEGTVDGEGVGGDIAGELDQSQTSYTGTYTNDNGKQKIECDADFHYFVAALGDWRIFSSDSESALEIAIQIIEDEVTFDWTEINDADVYRFIVVDQMCLEEQRDLEKCLVWGGESSFNSINYGEGGEVAAKTLVKGRDYIITVIALGNNDEPLGTASKSFRF